MSAPKKAKKHQKCATCNLFLVLRGFRGGFMVGFENFEGSKSIILNHESKLR